MLMLLEGQQNLRNTRMAVSQNPLVAQLRLQRKKKVHFEDTHLGNTMKYILLCLHVLTCKSYGYLHGLALHIHVTGPKTAYMWLPLSPSQYFPHQKTEF